MVRKPVVRLTAKFERNLADIERFLTETEAPRACDALLDADLHLLAIRHHRQLSFDFQSHWGGTSSMP